VFEEYITFSKQQKKTGFGLGLSICKKIINSHEGEISIESEVGKGTTIEFTLPV
jgi:signal transduction histidine kinase